MWFQHRVNSRVGSLSVCKKKPFHSLSHAYLFPQESLESLQPATTQKGPREEIDKRNCCFFVSNSTLQSTSSFWEFTDSEILRFCFVFSSLSLSLALWFFIKLKINQKVKDREKKRIYKRQRITSRIEESNKVQSSDETSFIVV